MSYFNPDITSEIVTFICEDVVKNIGSPAIKIRNRVNKTFGTKFNKRVIRRIVHDNDFKYHDAKRCFVKSHELATEDDKKNKKN